MSSYLDLWLLIAQGIEMLLRSLLKLPEINEIAMVFFQKKRQETLSLIAMLSRRNNWDVKEISFVISLCTTSYSMCHNRRSLRPPTQNCWSVTTFSCGNRKTSMWDQSLQQISMVFTLQSHMARPWFQCCANKWQNCSSGAVEHKAGRLRQQDVGLISTRRLTCW